MFHVLLFFLLLSLIFAYLWSWSLNFGFLIRFCVRTEDQHSVFASFLRCAILGKQYGGGGGGNNVLGLRFVRLIVDNVFCAWVSTLHVKLDASCVLGLTHFMLRWTRLLFFGSHTPCYVGNVFCTWLNTSHFTVDTSSALGLADFMLRWQRLPYLGWHTSC